MWKDPIVEETRRVRDELAAKLNYDIQVLGKYYKSQQETGRRIVVTRSPKRMAEESENIGPNTEPF